MTRNSNTSDPFPGPQSAGDGMLRLCQWRGCSEAGIHRAPIDRALSDYYVFCLDHVRAYNAQWNYHEGMSPDDMEMEYRSAATWDRPTWKLGDRQAPGRPWQRIFDPFDMYRDAPDDGTGTTAALPLFSTEETLARRTFGVTGSLTLDSLKARYKELVKRYHPDANGGSADAENRMKTINAAYQTLRNALKS
jgi:hypothetical protein